MKFNLTDRVPAYTQQIDKRTLEIYFMTDSEKAIWHKKGLLKVWDITPQTAILLIDQAYFETGSIKRLYEQDVNSEYLAYADGINSIKNRIFIPVFLGILIGFIAAATTIAVLSSKFPQVKSWSFWVLIGLLIIVFGLVFGISRQITKKMSALHNKFFTNILALVGEDNFKALEAETEEYKKTVLNQEVAANSAEQVEKTVEPAQVEESKAKKTKEK